MRKTCPWCQMPNMHAYRNPHKEFRRRLGQAFHILLLAGLVALLLRERYFEAGMALLASCALLYYMMCGSFFNDFRVCGRCARIEAVPGGIQEDGQEKP